MHRASVALEWIDRSGLDLVQSGPARPASAYQSRHEWRSGAWLTGDGEVAMAHRVVLPSSGLTVSRAGPKFLCVARGGATTPPAVWPNVL